MSAWLDSLPPDVAPAFNQAVDVNGTTTPLRELPFIKESTDLGSFVRKAYDAHREVGSRIPIRIERERRDDGTFVPKAESVTKWRTDHLPKLYENGILEKPPATPADYGIAKPADQPADLPWNEERASKLATLAHKHGLPKSAIPELLALHNEVLMEGVSAFKTSAEAAEAALRKEFPTDYEDRLEQSKRLTSVLFKNPEELALFTKSGLANHPAFLAVLMRLAPMAAADSSVGMQMTQQGGVTREQIQTELAAIINDPNNARHKLYMSGDPNTLAYVEGLYAKLPDANKTVQIGAVGGGQGGPNG